MQPSMGDGNVSAPDEITGERPTSAFNTALLKAHAKRQSQETQIRFEEADCDANTKRANHFPGGGPRRGLWLRSYVPLSRNHRNRGRN